MPSRWVDRAVARHWEALERLVGPTRMPRRYRRGGRWRVALLGAGEYGAVVPTRDPAVVLKLTTDAGEAAVAALALRLPVPAAGDPTGGGLVRYHAAARLPRGTRGPEGKPLFALWRERVEGVGQQLPWYRRARAPRADHALACLLEDYTDAAYAVRDDAPDAPPAEVNPLLPAAQAMLGPGFPRGWDVEAALEAMPSGAPRAALGLAISGRLLDLMGEIPRGRALARDLGRLAQHGLLVGDIHLNNLGHRASDRARAVVLMDPGSVVPASRAHWRLPRSLGRARAKDCRW